MAISKTLRGYQADLYRRVNRSHQNRKKKEAEAPKEPEV